MAQDHATTSVGSPSMASRAIAKTLIRRRWAWLLLVWVSASGAHCPQVLQQYTQPLPRALPPTANLSQIVDVVNDNSNRVRSFSTNRATVSTPGFPSVNADIAFQRPRSFRLLAQTPVLGPEVDLGSNDELIWFWTKRAQPPALFFCRHDQFAASSARSIIPVEPEWLIEALGIVSLDKNQGIEGPFAVGNGRVELRLKSVAPGNSTTRAIIVHDSLGVVMENHVYDGQRVRLASAIMSKHARDPASGVTLPRHVEIQWPTAQFNMSIDLQNMQVNQLPSDPLDLFSKPVKSGYTEIDLAQPNVLLPPPGSAVGPYRAPPAARY